ncbi:MAG: heavy-metal-associated domain-containing protein [Phycisphaerae bacterium]
MKRYRIDIGGMTCAHCVKTVTRALEDIEGVQDCGVDLDSSTADVTIDESHVNFARLVQAITTAGFLIGGFRAMDDTSPKP